MLTSIHQNYFRIPQIEFRKFRLEIQIKQIGDVWWQSGVLGMLSISLRKKTVRFNSFNNFGLLFSHPYLLVDGERLCCNHAVQRLL